MFGIVIKPSLTVRPARTSLLKKATIFNDEPNPESYITDEYAEALNTLKPLIPKGSRKHGTIMPTL